MKPCGSGTKLEWNMTVPLTLIFASSFRYKFLSWVYQLYNSFTPILYPIYKQYRKNKKNDSLFHSVFQFCSAVEIKDPPDVSLFVQSSDVQPCPRCATKLSMRDWGIVIFRTLYFCMKSCNINLFSFGG